MNANNGFQWMTAWFMVIFTMIVILFDLYVGTEKGAEMTISRQLLVIGTHYPVLVFIMGLLFGHIFWPQRL